MKEEERGGHWRLFILGGTGASNGNRSHDLRPDCVDGSHLQASAISAGGAVPKECLQVRVPSADGAAQSDLDISDNQSASCR